jgi:hypothetical protein
MLPTMFRFIWTSGFRGGGFFKSANQKKEWPVAAMFVKHGCHMQFLFLIGRFLKLDAILVSDWPIFKNLLL